LGNLKFERLLEHLGGDTGRVLKNVKFEAQEKGLGQKQAFGGR
jgi:hypothetical protein